MALRRQMQADLHEFDPSLVYRVASRTARATLRKPCLETQYKKQKKRRRRKRRTRRDDNVYKVFEPSSL